MMSGNKGLSRLEFLKAGAGALASVVAWPLASADAGGVQAAAQRAVNAQSPGGAALATGPRPWPAAARAWVRDRQEREYRRAAGELGLGSDPMAAYRRLSGRSANDVLSVPAVKQGLGLEFEFTPEEWTLIGGDIVRLQQRYLSADPPTPYEDRDRYAVVALMFDRIHDALARNGRPISPQPLLATLPSGNLNAIAVREPATRIPVIFFEQGLFDFLYDFAVVFAWAVPPLSREQLTSDVSLAQLSGPYAMPPQAPAFLAATLHAYVVNGTPRGIRSIPRPPHNLLLSYMLTQQMDRFALAHEVGHVALGHLSTDESMQQELDADAFALRLACDLARNDFGSWSVGFWGCQLMLEALHHFYVALATLTSPDRLPQWISKTHPYPQARIKELHNPKSVPTAPLTGVLGARTLSAMTEATSERLWLLAEVELQERYRRGDRPSAMWKGLIARTFAPA